MAYIVPDFCDLKRLIIILYKKKKERIKRHICLYKKYKRCFCLVTEVHKSWNLCCLIHWCKNGVTLHQVELELLSKWMKLWTVLKANSKGWGGFWLKKYSGNVWNWTSDSGGLGLVYWKNTINRIFYFSWKTAEQILISLWIQLLEVCFHVQGKIIKNVFDHNVVWVAVVEVCAECFSSWQFDNWIY